MGLGLPDKMAVNICPRKFSYFSETWHLSSKQDRTNNLGKKKGHK